jgi:hypothetical protein
LNAGRWVKYTEVNVKTIWAKWLWAAGLVVVAAGCASDRDRLEEERAQLHQHREGLQNQLDHHPVGTKWATHPDTMYALQAQQNTDQRIREIDQQVRELK